MAFVRIPQEIIDRVLQETNIVDVIAETVPLKKAGINFKACCPFHNEKTPSFVVSPHKQIYHCFGCGEGGTVIQFLMKQQGLNFREAMEMLAGRLHIRLPESGDESPENKKRQQYFKINQYARWFFRDQLSKTSKATAYLKGRKISDVTCESFQLGYGPDSFQAFTDFLGSKKIPLEMAADLGLIRTSQRSSGYYDFYRDRLIFPIHSSKGDVLGFGGRTLKKDSDEAKYINSPESPIYHKSFELYGFFENKKEILRQGKVLVVEGYTDVLACVELGLPIAVAPLGTSLTVEQIKKLARYDLEIILMFDGDAAGLKAAERGVDLALKAGFHPRIALLPEGQDPGDFLAQGNEMIKEIVEKAPYALDWMIADIARKAGSQASGQQKAMAQIQDWVKKLPGSIDRRPYLQKAHQYLGLPVFRGNKVIENPRQSVMQSQVFSQRLGLEEILLLVLLRDPGFFTDEEVPKYREGFENRALGELFEELASFVKKNETFTSQAAISEMPEHLQNTLTRVLASDEQYPDVDAKACSEQFWQKSKKRRLKQLSLEIAAAETQGQTDKKMQLLAEQQRILKES